MDGAQAPRKIRVRTCIGCGATSDKRELLRIVRAKDGLVAFDPTGRVAGRGAYVCSGECFAKARKSKRLERALKAKVDDSAAESIANSLKSYVEA